MGHTALGTLAGTQRRRCFFPYFTRSCRAISRMASSRTDVCPILSFWAIAANNRLASVLNRMLVGCFVSMVPSVPLRALHVKY